MTESALDLPPNFWLGTSSWSSDDWIGPFYPAGAKPADFLAQYAQHFRSVEIDSTWYRSPRPAMVDGWNAKTPDGFVFSAKVPRSITHEKALVDCDTELAEFMGAIERLGPKLGPLLLQFEYIAKGKDPEEYRTGANFLSRLRPFLKTLPRGHRFVVEVRNEAWLRPELTGLLHEHGVALALTSYFTMPPVERFLEKADPAGTGIAYVRFLGHHRQMDATVKKLMEEGKRASEWGALAVDREAELRRWAPVLAELVRREVPAYVYFNNHYAGYAPGSIEMFLRIWRERA